MKNPLLREIEEWTGHRNPRSKMKTSIKLSIALLAVIGAAIACSSCVTTTTTAPDGTVTKTTVTDPASVTAISKAVTDAIAIAAANRAVEVENSGK